MTITTVQDDQWYQFDAEGTTDIVCGICLGSMIAQTQKGKLSGDEAVTKDMVELLPDPDNNAYQCDECLEQSPGYDKSV